MTNPTTGAKYDPDLSLADIKKAVTADIAEAVAAGTLPAAYDYVVTANVRRGSGNQHVDVEVRGMADDAIFETDGNGRNRYSLEACKLLDVIRALVDAYNRIADDLHADYINRHLYTNITLEDSGRRELRELNARLAADKRRLRKALNDLGIHSFEVSTTGHVNGKPCAWTSLPLELVYRSKDIEAAGLHTRVGTYEMAVLTGTFE